MEEYQEEGKIRVNIFWDDIETLIMRYLRL
jgi:hypothetical protein